MLDRLVPNDSDIDLACLLTLDDTPISTVAVAVGIRSLAKAATRRNAGVLVIDRVDIVYDEELLVLGREEVNQDVEVGDGNLLVTVEDREVAAEASS